MRERDVEGAVPYEERGTRVPDSRPYGGTGKWASDTVNLHKTMPGILAKSTNLCELLLLLSLEERTIISPHQMSDSLH